MTSSLSCTVIGQEPLSIMELWGKFRSLRPDFISSYAAYHHFRSRGWVPKGGGAAKYGADLSKTHTLKFTVKYTQTLSVAHLTLFTSLFQCCTGKDPLSTTPGNTHTLVFLTLWAHSMSSTLWRWEDTMSLHWSYYTEICLHAFIKTKTHTHAHHVNWTWTWSLCGPSLTKTWSSLQHCPEFVPLLLL